MKQIGTSPWPGVG